MTLPLTQDDLAAAVGNSSPTTSDENLVTAWKRIEDASEDHGTHELFEMSHDGRFGFDECELSEIELTDDDRIMLFFDVKGYILVDLNELIPPREGGAEHDNMLRRVFRNRDPFVNSLRLLRGD